MAAMYGVWHGPDGLSNISKRINHLTQTLSHNIKKVGYEVLTPSDATFDTIFIRHDKPEELIEYFAIGKSNIQGHADGVSVSLNETTTVTDVEDLVIGFQQCAEGFDIEAAHPFEIPEYQEPNSSIK